MRVRCTAVLMLAAAVAAGSEEPRLRYGAPLQPVVELPAVPDELDRAKREEDAAGRLSFRTGLAFVPAPGIDPALPAPLQGIVVVQFPRLIAAADRAALAAAGVRIHDYVQGNAYLAEAPAAASAALAALVASGQVRAIVPYPDEAKVDPQLLVRAASGEASLRVAVEPFHGPARAPQDAIAQLMTVTRVDADPPLLRGDVDAGRLGALAALPEVKWIEMWVPAAVSNLEATMSSGADRVAAIGTYTGAGIRVAVDDTGITRTGSSTECGASGAAYHTDLPSSRILDQWDFHNNDATACDDDSHGTHVAGTIGGSGAYLDQYTGVAPAVSLLIYKDAGPPGSPNQFSNFGDVMSRAASHDANVCGNSWGSSNLAYTFNARTVDRGVNGYWNGSDGNPQFMVVTVAAGNNGIVTGEPALAKNGIAVGAAKDGIGAASSGSGYCFCVLQSMWQCVGFNCPSGVNLHCLDEFRPPWNRICFSNTGPVDTDADGNTRIKPDVMAPGTNVTSTAASHLIAGAPKYTDKSGTSMAQPQAAGTVALMMDSQPGLLDWPEMFKSQLLATATSMGSTSQYGHGMIDAYHAIYDSSSTTTPLWTGNYIGDGVSQDHTFTVSAGFDEVRVYLAYSDAVSTTTETVNDLDLRVYDGSGALVASSLSREDTVEYVRIGSGQSGTWRARVTGYNVPQPNAKYGISAVVIRTAPTLAMTATASDSCVRPNQYFTISSTVSGTAATVAATEAYIDFPGTTFTLDDATLTSADPGRDRLYLDTSLFQDTTNNRFYVPAGEVNQSMAHGITWGVRVSPGAADGNYTLALRATGTGQPYTGPNVAIEVDGTPPGNPAGLTSSDHALGACSSDLSVTMTWFTASDGTGCGVAGYAHSWSSSPELPWPIQTMGNVTTWTETLGPSASARYFNLRAFDNAGNWASTAASWGPFYLDNTAPGAATALTSPTHAVGSCSGSGAFQISWNAAPDTYCGLWGYSYTFTSTPSLPPASRNLAAVTSLSTTLAPSDSARYFNIRAVDLASNWSATYASYGPFTVDTIPGAVAGLVLAKSGADIALAWSATPSANYYRAYVSTDPAFATRTQVGGDVTATSTTHASGLSTPEPLLFYQVVGTNVCKAEGPY